MSTPRLSPTRSQANAALVVGTVALLMLGLQPILLVNWWRKSSSRWKASAWSLWVKSSA